MKNRRSFLTAVASSGVGMALIGKTAEAQSAPTPPASPSPEATPRPISPAAMAMALTYRTFDAALSDAEIEKIARGIDSKRAAGDRLNPKGALLKNADEPITRFTVPLQEVK